MICYYNNKYSAENAKACGLCQYCDISHCIHYKSKNISYGDLSYNPMCMSPNDYQEMINKKDKEIARLQKIVEEVTENIKIVGRQNTRLKRKCDRYERILTEFYLNEKE